MKYVLAISGGVDSVVLLDMISQLNKDIVVAHFDHGIREDSAADARFVEALANRYGVEFIVERAELGVTASEDLARRKRYGFLRRVAKSVDGKIVTAHHQDDVVETIAMNLSRGSGWRGVSCMNDKTILRPMVAWTKRDIYQYVVERRLEWVEDETNQSGTYARNLMRRRLGGQINNEQRLELYNLWQKQRKLRREIEWEMAQFDQQMRQRYFLTQIDEKIAINLLYYYIVRHMNVSLLSAQLERMLIAIKTGQPNTLWQIGSKIVMKLTAESVIIERVE